MADIDASLESLKQPEYLGDGLYVSWDGWQIRLYAHNGVEATNEVFLEPEVLVAFLRYTQNLKRKVDDAIP
jgi:hypothetical protein